VTPPRFGPAKQRNLYPIPAIALISLVDDFFLTRLFVLYRNEN